MTWVPKFKTGDKVQIVMDLDDRQHAPGINDEMRAMRGMICTIRRTLTREGSWYALNESGWSWAKDWLDYPYPEIEDI